MQYNDVDFISSFFLSQKYATYSNINEDKQSNTYLQVNMCKRY